GGANGSNYVNSFGFWSDSTWNFHILATRGEAALVYMDEVSHEKLKQPLNASWDRTLHARLIDRLTAAGARAIVFDIIFTDPDNANPSADQTFAKAMKASGRVILAADNVRVG